MFNHIDYSPLSKIKAILKVQRILLGFPLKAENVKFSKFLFSARLEYARYFMFLSLASFGHVVFVFTTFGSHGRGESKSWKNSSDFLNISPKDTLPVDVYSFISLLSCFLYIKSYNTNYIGINKICQKIILTRRYMQQVAPRQNHGKPTHVTTYLARYPPLLLGYGITIWVILSIVCMWWDEGEYSRSMAHQEYQTGLFVVLKIIFACSYCYPMIASSTDLLVSHLLQEVNSDFEIWAKLLKSHKITNDQNTYKRGSHSDINSTITSR